MFCENKDFVESQFIQFSLRSEKNLDCSTPNSSTIDSHIKAFSICNLIFQL